MQVGSDGHNERDRVLTAEEWARLYRKAAPHLKPILVVAYHLGQRYGEIVNLTWDRVDLKREMIRLRAIDTKTKQPRKVPITPELTQVFRDLYKVRYLGQDRVFLRDGEAIGLPLNELVSELGSKTSTSTTSDTARLQI